MTLRLSSGDERPGSAARRAATRCGRRRAQSRRNLSGIGKLRRLISIPINWRSREEFPITIRRIRSRHSPPSAFSLQPSAFPQKTSGFTLTELLVVIVIVGIMTAVILPEMRGTYEDALLRSTSRKLISAFDLAYSRAVSQNQPHRVRLDTTEGRFLLERYSRQGMQEMFVPASDVPGGSGELDSRISIRIVPSGVATAASSAPENPGAIETDPLNVIDPEGIVFYQDGTADAADIILRDREGFRLALRINPVTARIRILDLPRE